MSRPLIRTHNILFVDKLFNLQEQLFQYLLRCVELLNSKELSGYNLSVDRLIPLTANALKSRFELVSKYSKQIKVLTSFDEVEKIYMTIYEFLFTDLELLETAFSAKSRNFHIKDSTALSTDDSNFLSHFVNYLFPEDQIVRVLRFVQSSPAKIREVRDNQSQAESFNGTIIPEIFADLVFDTDIDVTKKDLEAYNILYPKRRSDKKHGQLFKLSILKELAFSPKLNEEFESKYENSILRSILDNESDTSPKTFNDDQQAILDVMEVLTFHIDTITQVIGLVEQFCEIAIIKEIPPMAKTPAPYHPDEYYMRISGYLHTYSITTVEQHREYIIGLGTVGLSLRTSYEDVRKMFHNFIAYLNVVIGSDPKPRNPRLFYKDELHFMSTLREYINVSKCLLEVIKDRSAPDIKNESYEEFEDCDGEVKDVFFKMNHFSQRFKYEMEIAMIARGELI